MRVLIVEDQARIARDIASALESAGFVAEIVGQGDEAWYKGDCEPFDAVVLDLGLPVLDGLSILKRWRADGRSMPVIILTARDNWRDKVEGIDAGADDYLAKPFQMEELVARVRGLARRAVGQRSPILKHGVVEIDTRRQSVSVAGSNVAITALEYRLLAYLMLHSGRVVTQTELSEHIHDQSLERDSNAIEVLVARTRRKLGVSLIETRRGLGYIIPAFEKTPS